MEFTINKLAKEVAEKALDEILYDGKSIREWMQIIASEDCISREDAINVVHNYFMKYLELNDDICLDGIRSLSPVTPKTSCESCREQVLKCLEKEDWADTVNCVMTMPFMKKKELNKRFGVKKEINDDEDSD